MKCFNWLHLTDLHWGSDDHKDYWGSIEPKWFEDIDGLKEKCGGEWDAVFFTGDLVNKGEKSEFAELTGQLKRLFHHLKKTGSGPYLLVIPGNHDLKRPTPSAAGCKALTHLWDTDEDIRNSIWRKKEDTDYWKTIQAAFENFQQWLDDAKNHFPIPPGMKPGLLPGEFTVTLEKGDNKIGVIGLNTAFLQLSKGLYKDRLDAHPAQVIELCGKNHQDWVNQHDICLILTHHPMDWLSPRGKDEFESVIAPPGRFALHLCGHQHEALLSQFTSGGAPDARRFICGCSLFGLQKYVVDWQNNTKKDRRHGYSAGCIDFSKQRPGLRIWPRLGLKKSDKVWSFDRDQEFYLEDDGGIKEILLETKRKNRPHIMVGNKDDIMGGIGGDNRAQAAGTLSIKTLVNDNITKLLDRKKMERFRHALNNRLNQGKKEKPQYEIDQMAAMLIDMSVLDAILMLDMAVKDCIEAIKDADGSIDLINDTWNNSVSILGWIVLPGVDDEWADNTSRSLADRGENLELIIPVNTEAGAEIAFSRLKQEKAGLRIDENSQKVLGVKGIPCDGWDIEDGFYTPDKVLTIKKILWKQLIKVDPPGEFTKDTNDELNETLLIRRKKGEHHYIAVDQSCENNPLLKPEVYKALINDLPDLEIFLIGSNERGVVIIGEPKLHARLREFFSNQPA